MLTWCILYDSSTDFSHNFSLFLEFSNTSEVNIEVFFIFLFNFACIFSKNVKKKVLAS